jgi:PIN domain nuclease of toxin-antitoxin system
MTLLLDTCVFLWWLSDEGRIPAPIRRRLQRQDTDLVVSVASAWEIAIKVKLGKLEIPSAPRVFVREAVELYRMNLLSIDLDDAVRAGELPLHHKDPFDRLLIAQAQLRRMKLVTPDSAFAPYGLDVLW